MNGANRKTCIFCVKTIRDDQFDVVGEITMQMLDGLLIKVNLDNDKEAVMCHECSTKLQNALDFKTACLNIENKILPYLNSDKNMKLVLKEESVVKLTDLSEDQRVCRFCMKLLEKGFYTNLQETKENIFLVDIIKKHIPELHLNVTEELVTCAVCLITLQDLVSFIADCSNAEKKIKEDMDEVDIKNGMQDLKNEINTSNVNVIKMEEKYDKSLEKITVKGEPIMEIDNPEISLKSGENEIISTPNFRDRLQAATSSSQFLLKDVHDYEKCTSQNIFDKHNQADKSASDITMYNCEMCSYKTKYEHFFKKHAIIHEKPSDIKMFKCELCTYSAKLPGNLKKHMLIHQNPLEVQMYSCEKCSFATKRKGTLIKHMRVHRGLSEVIVYKCETCLFESKHKHSLDRHVLTHQNPSELTVYKCESCCYETKHKSHLNVHMVTHKNPSEMTMFQCEICTFETKRKKTLKKHWLTHQDTSEVTWFKCDNCLFQTKRKDGLKKHLLIHQDQSEVTLYKCEKCSFETKHKVSLGRHYLIHQEAPEATVYKCDKCSYSTKRKCHLKLHVRIHLNPSGIGLYNCEICSFKTKYQRSFDKHLLKHL